jgi:hypothetical protein
MKRVKVKDRTGVTTSVIPQSNGKYPVWFDNTTAIEFIASEEVEFIGSFKNRERPTCIACGVQLNSEKPGYCFSCNNKAIEIELKNERANSLREASLLNTHY